MKTLGVSVVCLLLVACGGGGGSSTDVQDNSLSQSTRIATSQLPIGSEECPNGGVQLDSGFDNNDNDTLDSEEISVSKIVCNGADGLTSLVRIYDEASGNNCVNGGKRIVTGLDLNSDELLSSDEIQDTQYICNIDGAGNDGSSCTVNDNQDGTATISCEDGSSADLTNGSLIHLVQCSSFLDGAFSNNWWSYQGYELANGDVYLTAGVAAASSNVINTMIYSPNDPNYNSAPIFIGHDVYGTANGGFWELKVNSNIDGIDIIYKDIDVSGGVVSWAEDFSNCTLFDYSNP